MHLTNYAINKRSNKYIPPGKSKASSEAETRSTAVGEHHHTSSAANNKRVGGFVEIQHDSSPRSNRSNTHGLETKDDHTTSRSTDHKCGLCGKGLKRTNGTVVVDEDGVVLVNLGQDVPVAAETERNQGGLKDDGRDERGSKRSLEWFFRWLEEGGRDAGALWREVANLVVKTLASAQPSLAQAYRSCFCGETRGTGQFREYLPRSLIVRGTKILSTTSGVFKPWVCVGGIAGIALPDFGNKGTCLVYVIIVICYRY